MTTRFQTERGSMPARVLNAHDFNPLGNLAALRDGVALQTAAGQGILTAVAAAEQGVTIFPNRRRVAENYNPYRDEDMTGLERWADEFVDVTSPEEFQMVKQMILTNMDLRSQLADYPVTSFMSGFLDPINLVPVPFALGKGFINGLRASMPAASGIIVGTELARQGLDPTDTPEELLFNIAGGILFSGAIAGTVGHYGHIGKTTVGDMLDKLVPPEALPKSGTVQATFGVPPWLGGKNAYNWIKRKFSTNAVEGDPLSEFVEGLKTVEDGNEVRIFHPEIDEPVLEAVLRGGDTLQLIRADVPVTMQRQGIGTAAYKQAIKLAESRGWKVTSDTVTSKAAMGVWRNLEDEGFNIWRNPESVMDEHLGSLNTVDGRPNYEVRPQAERDIVPIELRLQAKTLKESTEQLDRQLADVSERITLARRKLKTATKKGGWRTKRKNELNALLEEKKLMDFERRQTGAALEDANVMIRRLVEEDLVDDFDLVPTGYDKMLGKWEQFPFFFLLKNPWRKAGNKKISKALQLFALKTAQTPGLNLRTNRLGHSAGVSVESSAKVWHGTFLDVKNRTDQLYLSYLGHGDNTTRFNTFMVDAKQRVRGVFHRDPKGGPMRTTAEGEMTLREWDNQITKAIITGNHSNPKIDEAAKMWVNWLNEVGDEGRKLGVFTTQRSLNRQIQRYESQIEMMEEQASQMKDPAARLEMGLRIHDKKLDIEQMRSRLEAYENADSPEPGSPGWIHRIYIPDQVRERAVELKNHIREKFTENPFEGHYQIRMGDRIEKVSASDPDAINARVEEAFSSILREADLGGEADFTISSTDKLEWLRARHKEVSAEIEAGKKVKENSVRLKIIEGKIERVREGQSITGSSGPLITRKLDLDDEVLFDLGVIEQDVSVWGSHYIQRLGPTIEMARTFGDPAAEMHINQIHADMIVDANARAADNPKQAKQLLESAAKMRTAMEDLRDIVLGHYQMPKDPMSLTNRTLRALRNWNVLSAMGRSVAMAVGDTGNIVMSQGFRRTFGHQWERMMSSMTDGSIHLIDKEVELAGTASEVAMGMRYVALTDPGSPQLAPTRFERALAGGVQRFFIYNLMGPWTDMARKWGGGMVQSRLVENSLLWRAGRLSADEQAVMTRLGIDRQQARQIASEWEQAGELKHKNMWIANTESWASDQAKRVFRAALNTEIDRMVPTPGAADKPKILLKSEWWKVIGQYRGFTMGATHRIMAAGLQQKGAQKYAGFASMIAIAGMVDAFKRPDYIKLPIEEQILRAVELSGVTGIILDINDSLERASAGGFGLRPALGMDIRERDPNWANRWGTIGAVPNQWMTLAYGLTSDDADTADLTRAIRYSIPYNNLIWFNEATNRMQRSATEFLEEDE